MDLAGRFDMLRRLVENPTGDTAALAVAIGIGVLLVLVLVLVLLAYALPGEQLELKPEETPEQAQARRSTKRRARLAGAAVLFIASLAATAAWYHSTSTVTYCTRTCHQMAEPAASWRSSAHRSVSCTRCHEGRKWFSMPAGVAARVRSLYYYTADVSAQTHRVGADICLDCHTGLLDEEVTALNGETYVHRPDYRDGRPCRDCHGTQGHVKPVSR